MPRTLSGILRLSPRRSILSLKVSCDLNSFLFCSSVPLQDRFVRQIRASHLPSRDSPDYNKAIRERHGAILGVCALIDSYPYTVEKWMPDLLATVLAEHTYDPVNMHIAGPSDF
jgi:proteasome activator subunit 4